MNVEINKGTNSAEDMPILTIEMAKINLTSFEIIHNLLAGTDSDEWLKEAENG